MDYADSSFLVSIYLDETTTKAAEAELFTAHAPLAITPLLRLEIRNAFNLALNRKRITRAQCDESYAAFLGDIANGILREVPLASGDLHDKAIRLSDLYTPTLALRSLDLLHVAAALQLGAKTFYSFDERQRKAAAGEGLKVKPR